MTADRSAAPRDQEPSPFSQILEGFCRVHPTVLAAALVDSEGECVDYFSLLDPFEAKVAGAQLVALLAVLRDRLEAVELGQSRVWIIEAERRDLVMACAWEDYAVVVILEGGGLQARTLLALDSLIEALAREAGFEFVSPDCVQVDVSVEVDGRMLPRAVTGPEGSAPVVRVLANWAERGLLSEAPLSCFRVETTAGEMTLVHDPKLNRWRFRLAATDSRPPRRRRQAR